MNEEKEGKGCQIFIVAIAVLFILGWLGSNYEGDPFVLGVIVFMIVGILMIKMTLSS